MTGPLEQFYEALRGRLHATIDAYGAGDDYGAQFVPGLSRACEVVQRVFLEAREASAVSGAHHGRMEREHLYQPGDVIESRDGRRMLVLAVGQEAYFLRRLNAAEGDDEPVETAWEIAGCEDKTWLVAEGHSGQP